MTANISTSRPYQKQRNIQWGTVARHLVINFFMLIILLPLAWVLLLSIKSVPDAYTGKLWPEVYDFTHYSYVLDKIDTPQSVPF